ncbi:MULTISPECIES: TonB-dependent receptor [Bosea]|uniref:TonB-dependent receptor n=1 Tax=Bosea TaxID=85413 RepID=UPI002150362E|nr:MULTISPECIES: TonB-dependent receptor [Bosea]MCR4523280.1 TonB-dependent receptor [Bosea sp. 47.2.35]MDR6830272.1 hemoglobin/transferrin/lactoferrin receptor protein [Bosea robiniae]MDR6895605.1 hemoglobin/transferrin/lactoferrin receptor protein [Bosea sp. BE109]MDR7139000.1 hemoglobin/transferrin/lactoferrin receptor protein [Bosea sp. BE168]MDR7175701.1 hemoglobin/transferrin/lactoferrin receptor protein [Bosea sp. BE271]
MGIRVGARLVRQARLAAALCGTALAAGIVSLPAMAQSARTLDIPAQPVSSALIAFSRQTGIAVVAPASATAGKRSAAVNGALSSEAALSRLLAGTGLNFRFTSATSVTISAAGSAGAAGGAVPEGAIALDTIDVAGNPLARGGVAEILIGPRELERRNPTDIRDVFGGEPRVKVGGSTPMSQKVYVNGVEETNLAVTIDGSRQNNKVFHHNGTTLIDPSFLKAARIDAGVAPADAGPGALAGAIAYETKDARDFLTGNGVGAFAKTQFNTNGSVFTNSLSGYARYEGFDVLAYGTIGKGDNYKAGDGREVLGTQTDLLSGLFKLGWEAPTGDRFQISHERVRDDALRPFRGNIGFITGRPAWEPRVRRYEIDRQNTVFTYSRTSPIGLWDPKAVIAYSRTDVDTPIFERPVGSNPLPVTYPGTGVTDSFNGKFENRFGFGEFGNVVAGVDFYKDKALYKDRNYRVSEKASNLGVYAQARLKPFERMRLSFGLRGDRQWFTGTTGQEFDNSGLSRNISAEFDLIPEHLTVRAGYSHVWGGVQLAENFIMNTAWRYGRGVRPVHSDNVIAGLVGRWNGFTLEGSVFRTELENARAARFAVASATLAREIESQGYEIGLGYAWEDGYIRGKYASVDVRIDGQRADSDTGTYLATPIGDVFTLTAAHTFKQWGVTVGADVEIVRDYKKVAPGNLPLKGYEVVNLFAEYKPLQMPNLTFRAEVKNLLDQTYADRATYGQEFGTVTPLYQPGRAFVLSASARF